MAQIVRWGPPLGALVAVSVWVVAAAGEPIARSSPASECTYVAYKWNVKRHRATDRRRVRRARSALRPYEISTVPGCTMCREDQERIALPPIPSFAICRTLAPTVRATLAKLISDGVPIVEVLGHRTGWTRGEIDAQGNRTAPSAHAYGIALDINPGQNGQYDRCPTFGPRCRLRHGGPWQPGRDPRSLRAGGPIVRALERIGFRWSGRSAGRVKDFMHFTYVGPHAAVVPDRVVPSHRPTWRELGAGISISRPPYRG